MNLLAELLCQYKNKFTYEKSGSWVPLNMFIHRFRAQITTIDLKLNKHYLLQIKYKQTSAYLFCLQF